MDIASLRTFLAAADTGSFSGAAQRVNASPSSVTDRIKQLEHRLGVRLFDRDKRGCRLTPAGQRFLGPAAQSVRALDIARHEVSLPEQFTRSVAFGGQYILWDQRLLGWLARAREEFSDLAFRVTSGASARLNRDLAEGFLDMAVLYDPVFRSDIGSQLLFEDKLILVAACAPDAWKDNYIRIEWGRGIGAQIASRFAVTPQSGLVLDLGGRSADWLVANKMAGYMPKRSVARMMAQGLLQQVEATPEFDFPAYISWRRDLDPALASELVESLRRGDLVGG